MIAKDKQFLMQIYIRELIFIKFLINAIESSATDESFDDKARSQVSKLAIWYYW